MSEQSLDPHAFRRALGNFATGITVVTAQNTQGERIGLTVNSFNSVSLDPPLILWSLDKRSADSLDVIRDAGHFAINVLAADQLDLSNQFARPQKDKFAGVEFSTGAGGSPLLDQCAASFQCALHQEVDAGDHWILLGRVLAFDDFGRAPLLYHQGAYSLVIPHPRVAQRPESTPEDEALQGRLANNLLYLMLQAVNAYQSAYLPKQQSLGLSVSESRLLILLSSRPGADTNALALDSALPGSEIREALDNLKSAGLVCDVGPGFSLTEQGRKRAREYWALSEQEQSQVFADFSSEQIAQFKEILNRVIKNA
ncbi:NADH-FMN oxidoreductase [Marinobacterium lacunae]|uniref:NADH-FMN oxidoreductase n=1 Tax=Marinobacterium lacunae TaxID=1232683 RepID=A0A081G404_9GAMM|nr:flavin reductase [Marinobacterium lacunae]KEA65509.1 NADH-FMN oxidoreductase [Marinobacterium lacunae]